MAKKEYHINVQVIKTEDVANCLQDMAVMGMLDVTLAINDRDYVMSMVALYFNSANQFREILGLPKYILPEKDTDEDDE